MTSLIKTTKRLGALLVLTGVLAGCVVVPARPYYYHPHPYWHYY